MVADELIQSSRLRRLKKGALVIDIVESVRLFEQDEDEAIAHWLAFVEIVEKEILPKYDGRLVKSLGDGLLVEFADCHLALEAAFSIQAACRQFNLGYPNDRQIFLRAGLEFGEVVVGERDIYGRGVNLAARLAQLAGPGETVVSDVTRDLLVADVDAEIEDLGECYLKHIDHPVRAYRVRRAGSRPTPMAPRAHEEILPLIAVIPFQHRTTSPEDAIVGEVIAEDLIHQLAQANSMRVISRLSTSPIGRRDLSASVIGAYLGANYVLSGTFRKSGNSIIVNAELADAKTGQIVFAERVVEPWSALLSVDQDMIGALAGHVYAAIMSRELVRARTQSISNLESYALLMSAIGLMHRLSVRDFELSLQMLRALIDRENRQAAPRAWMAKWHVLSVQQGWSVNSKKDAGLALDAAKRALDFDPCSSLALAIDGLVHTVMIKNHAIAAARLNEAVEVNPSDPLAWLFKGALHAFTDDGERAVESTQKALALSPLDPHRYLFESLAATAHLTAGNWQTALDFAERSYRTNRSHASTLRVMAVAQQMLGAEEAACETAQKLMSLEPSLTVSGYLKRAPSAGYRIGEQIARTLREIGVPE